MSDQANKENQPANGPKDNIIAGEEGVEGVHLDKEDRPNDLTQDTDPPTQDTEQDKEGDALDLVCI